MNGGCTHLDRIRDVTPSAWGCEESRVPRRHRRTRDRLYRMDREMQGREMRTLAAAPDYVVGSVHALTEGGSLLIASASGSQLGPLVSGAAHAILVIGAQKVVSYVATGMRRIYEYCYPLEVPGRSEPTEWPAG